MEYSERDYRLESVRARFLCMITPRNLPDEPSQINNKFELNAKIKSTVGVDTPRYTVRLWTTDPGRILFDEQQGVLLLLYGDIFKSWRE